jgi:hypothetical protein
MLNYRGLIMKYLILLGLLIPLSVFPQTDISINKKAGEREELKIVNSNKITFTPTNGNDEMYIRKNDGTTDVFRLSEVNYILFNGISAVDNINLNLLKVNNYPNPSELKTTFEFTLDKRSNIELSIFDVDGSLMKLLIKGTYDIGDYNIDWDLTGSNGKKVSTGNYFYQLKVDNIIITKQLIIIK